jgi:predicted acyltransferase
MVNAEEGYNEQAMHMSIFLWNLLFYAAAILVWNAYPFTNKTLERGLRLAGILALLTLACIFRGGKDGSVYLAPQWWGILGLIGWAYLIACIVYQLSNGRIAPIMIALALCSGYYCAAHLEAVNQSFALRIIFSQTDNASHTSIALGGVITSLIFFDRNKSTSTVGRFAEAMLLALAMVVAGYFLRPYFKISKIYATPTWCLYSAAICVVLFALLYWLIDLKKLQAWTTFFKPAASNPLLTYLIPFIIYSLMQYLNLALPETFNQGVMAIIWSASYAVTVMGMVTILNRLHIRLQL